VTARLQGELVTLTCLSTGGNPPPALAWYRNNMKLQYQYHRLANGSTVSVLELRAEESLLRDRCLSSSLPSISLLPPQVCVQGDEHALAAPLQPHHQAQRDL
jgi:hypothetical protein